MTKPLFDATARSAVEFGGTGSAMAEFGDLHLARLPKRSKWKPVLVIGLALAGAVALGMLTGCASPHGPEMLPGTMPLPDGSKLAAFDAISKPDKWGLSATDGVGLLRIDPEGHATVEGWSTTQGPSDAGIMLQLAAGVAGSIGGGAISGGLAERGLNTSRAPSRQSKSPRRRLTRRSRSRPFPSIPDRRSR